MLRPSLMWAAALVAASLALALGQASAGGYYGGRFVPSAMPGHLHEYQAFNANCAFLRRLVRTPVGPNWQLVPVCV